MTRMSDQVLSAGWPAIADDLRKHERDRVVAAAIAENDDLMDANRAADAPISPRTGAWCCVASSVVAVGVGLLITYLCGGF